MVFSAVIPGVTANTLDSEPKKIIKRNIFSKYMFFLNAVGGTGKNSFTKEIKKMCKIKRKRLASVVTYVMASQLLDRGRTAHSVFKIQIPINSNST